MDQRAIERAHISQHFLLHNDSPFVLMHELNWVLDSNNFATSFLIYQVEHIIERRRLPCASGTGNQNQAVWPASQVVNFFGEAQFLAGRYPLAAKAKTHFGMAVATIECHSHAA